MHKRPFLMFVVSLVLLACSVSESTQTDQESDSTLYFPPLDNDQWETVSTSEIGWNEEAILDLNNFLDNKNTKGFIILHKGKIVIEEYFNGHSATDLWYWASAGKTLTSTAVGIAEDQGLLSIENSATAFLGEGWTSLQTSEEQLITIKNLLSMTSGLDDAPNANLHPSNLVYKDEAGQRWAYHNVFLKLQDIVANSSGTTWSEYFNSQLRDKIGMNGRWVSMGDLNVYWSDTKSIARFGLMISANGLWDENFIVSSTYLADATKPSQSINDAYGYLWWINGSPTYMLPQSQIKLTGSLIPNAPDDMYCALGKNDQKIYIIPSKDLVIIRVGDAADNENFTRSNFDNELWEKLNAILD